MPRLSRISIHPFKSFDPQSVDEARVLDNGALEHDRRFVLVDAERQWVNGKRTPAVHLLRTSFDPATNLLTLRTVAGEIQAFDVYWQRAELQGWLGEYFGMPVEILESTAGGFPDDTDSPGPTLVSTASLAAIGDWFGIKDPDRIRARFRTTLEIEADEPFWEDRLVAEVPDVVRFRIGAVEFWGTTACQRCIVPTRDPFTGEVSHGFSKAFAQHRRQALPAYAPASRFDHFYRLAVNTCLAQGAGSTLRVGDEVQVIGRQARA